MGGFAWILLFCFGTVISWGISRCRYVLVADYSDNVGGGYLNYDKAGFFDVKSSRDHVPLGNGRLAYCWLNTKTGLTPLLTDNGVVARVVP